MWILKFLPDWIFLGILIAGAIGIVISKFLPAAQKQAALLISSIAFTFGVFMMGAISDNNAWVARVKEMEAKVAQAEEEAKAANENINKTTEVKIKVIKEKGAVIKQYIDREIVKYDTGCIIPKEFIKAHNDAAEAPKK
jgi:4-hydroxyphenylpyruvate dioxygenase-like putative hemolysin